VSWSHGGDGVGGSEGVVGETAKFNKPECEEAVASVVKLCQCGILQLKQQLDFGEEYVSAVAI
jgi:hypothetical protein